MWNQATMEIPVYILTLPEDDIVHHTYKQQLQYHAPNWANEVAQLRTTYHITESDNDIKSISKERWKTIVKRNVANQALADLSKEASTQKHAQNLLPYQILNCQQYIHKLSPAQCRKIFHIRSQTVDLRTVRRYTYGDLVMCRLCSTEEETVEHVVNNCPEIIHPTRICNIFTTAIEELSQIAKRCIDFDAKVDVGKAGCDR